LGREVAVTVVAANPLDGYLIELEKIVQGGASYCADGPWRCDNSRNCVDCSGMVVCALNNSGTVTPCTNSFAFATICHQAARPDWMTAAYGPGVGTEIPMSVAMMTPGAWGFHGDNEGQAPDRLGDGHIKTSVGGGRSIEAMSHAAGVGYSIFDSPPGFIGYTALPPMLIEWFAPPAPKVPPEMDEQLRAILRNPGKPGVHAGGWWLGYDNGLVDFLIDGGIEPPVRGGMISPDDVKNFAAHGEHLARLELRTRADGSPGFRIIATDGNTYIPQNEV